MSKSNILVSLAYIKTEENPLQVFCNYILYALAKSRTGELRHDQLCDYIKQNFINMPQFIIKSCINLLKKEDKICSLPNGAGYKLTKKYDASKMDEVLKRLSSQESELVNSLQKYVNELYEVSWSYEEAQTYLSNFLYDEGQGAKIFLENVVDIEVKKIQPSWYVGRYIRSLLQNESDLNYQYLVDMVNGMMILGGLCQTNDNVQMNQKFQGTIFYLDTKIILRLLGYSWEANVQAARELIQLIRYEYGAKVKIFETTRDEVANALARAGEQYSKSGRVDDYELNYFAEMNSLGAELFCERSESFVRELERDYDIEVEDKIDWDDNYSKRYNIDSVAVKNYMLEHGNWNYSSLENDIQCIVHINILRKGDYSVRYGGKKKLPVFVTPNSGLVTEFRKYVQSLTGDDASYWNIHNLPLITDNMLLYRLWVPYSKERSSVPAITLARFAFASENPDDVFFSKLRERAIKYQEERGVDLMNLSETRRKKFEDLIVKNSKGNEEFITDELVAMSIDELVKNQTISLQDTIDAIQVDNQDKAEEIEEKENRIITLNSEKFINKIGIGWQLLVLFSRFWWILAVIILAIMKVFVDGFFLINSISDCYPIIPAIIQIIFSVLDKATEKIHINPYKKSIRCIYKHYVKRIKEDIVQEDMQYIDRIIIACTDGTSLFAKNKKFIEDLVLRNGHSSEGV